jgi:hypothetical protein
VADLTPEERAAKAHTYELVALWALRQAALVEDRPDVAAALAELRQRLAELTGVREG